MLQRSLDSGLKGVAKAPPYLFLDVKRPALSESPDLTKSKKSLNQALSKVRRPELDFFLKVNQQRAGKEASDEISEGVVRKRSEFHRFRVRISDRQKFFATKREKCYLFTV